MPIEDTLPVNTHHGIDRTLCGQPTALGRGTASVRLDTTPPMAADDHGLVHGGFVFGAADYAAMLAVNDPNVVLGAAETRFLAPVRVGQAVVLHARVDGEKGRKRTVSVEASTGEKTVFTGIFTCFILDSHVLGD